MHLKHIRNFCTPTIKQFIINSDNILLRVKKLSYVKNNVYYQFKNLVSLNFPSLVIQ